MTPETIKQSVEKFGSYVLRYLRDKLEAELLADMAAGVQGNQTHLGKLEMLRAIGEVLDERNALNTPPATVLVWYEDNCKLQRPITVF